MENDSKKPKEAEDDFNSLNFKNSTPSSDKKKEYNPYKGITIEEVNKQIDDLFHKSHPEMKPLEIPTNILPKEDAKAEQPTTFNKYEVYPDLNGQKWINVAQSKYEVITERYTGSIDLIDKASDITEEPKYWDTPNEPNASKISKQETYSQCLKARNPKKTYFFDYPVEEEKFTYSIEEVIVIIDELLKKNIGDLVIAGSVGLFLQDKLNRSSFGDIDFTYSSNLELDEELEDRSHSYEKEIKNCKGVWFNHVPIDFFKKDSEINIVEVNYNNKTYICQNYKDIIFSKIEMVTSNIKDWDYLSKNYIDINIV